MSAETVHIGLRDQHTKAEGSGPMNLAVGIQGKELFDLPTQLT